MRIVTFFGGSIQHKGDRIMKRSRINEVIRDMEALGLRSRRVPSGARRTGRMWGMSTTRSVTTAWGGI